MLRSLHACAGMFVLLSTFESRGAQIAVQFQGTVTESYSAPFGRSVPFATPVIGRFVYESTSVATHPATSCDCTGYRQQIVNGFTADFGGVTIRADDYIVDVGNDVEFNPGEVYDHLTVLWHSAASPPPTAPLLVNGRPFTTGLFAVSLSAFPEVLASSALPPALNLADFVFPDDYNTLGDYLPSLGNVDVLYEVASAAPTTHLGGDFNFDQVVDGADLLRWQRDYADAPGLAAWRSSFGQMSSPAAESHAAIVPEPSGHWLAPAAALAMDWRNRRRRTAYSTT